MKRFTRVANLTLLLLALLVVPAVHAQDSSDQILYQVGNGDASSVYRLNLEDGSKTQIGIMIHAGDEIKWSPAGKFITLLTFDDPDSPTLTLIDAETGRSQIISGQLDLMPCTYPFAWSHDDEWLSYMAKSNSEPVRKLLNLKNGMIQVLPNAVSGYDDIQWSADNRYLAYKSFASDLIDPVNVWDTQNQKTLMTLDVEFHTESPQFLNWSPVENQLAFISAASHKVSIYNPSDNTTHEYNANALGDWSPDGKFLTLYRRDTDNQMKLLVLDVFEGKVVQLDQSLEEADIATTAAWSPDSHYLAMTIRTVKENKIWVLDIQTNHLYDTLITTSENGPLVWSPAGNQLAFPSDQDTISGLKYFTSLWIFDADHQKKHHYDVQISVFSGEFEWSPNGRYLTLDDGLLDWEMGAINTAIQSFSEPRWSPDGTKLALTSFKQKLPDIYIFNPDGNTLQNVTNTPDKAEYFIGWRGVYSTSYLVFCGGEG